MASAVLSVGCARLPFVPTPIEALLLEARAADERDGDIRVRMAMLQPDEIDTLIGVDLVSQGIQPIWIEVTNSGDTAARLALASIDPNYFPPFEVAWMNRKEFRRSERAALERWLYENRVERHIPAGATQSGLLFVHTGPGTRAFNADVYVEGGARNFMFFLRAEEDGMRRLVSDPEAIYRSEQISLVERRDEQGLASALSQAACCLTGVRSDHTAPVKVMLIGNGAAVQQALIRAGWNHTAGIDAATQPALVYAGRTPDGLFTRARRNRADGPMLNLWLAPLTVGAQRVWLAQPMSSEAEFPDLAAEGSRNVLLQDLLYAQSIAAIGVLPESSLPFEAGAARNDSLDAPPADPGTLVLLVADEPVAMDATEFLELAQTAR